MLYDLDSVSFSDSKLSRHYSQLYENLLKKNRLIPTIKLAIFASNTDIYSVVCTNAYSWLSVNISLDKNVTLTRIADNVNRMITIVKPAKIICRNDIFY